MNDRDPLLNAIDAIRAKPDLVPEADALLKQAAESSQGKPLAEIVAELESDLSRFITFMRLCFDNRELKTQFDRLRGTNVSRRGSPMNVMIDDATGKFEADARAFFEFCLDLYQRLPTSTSP